MEARKLLTKQLEGIGGSRKDPGALIESYADNEFDRLMFSELEARSSLARNISSAMNFGSAILMATVFFLVSSEGAFDENKVVWMVIFIFGLRMVVAQGKTAMVKWGGILAEKKTLMAVAKGSLNSPLSPAEGSPDPKGDAVRRLLPRPEIDSGPRIVDYPVSGLNAAELVFRERYGIEMSIESDTEFKGVRTWRN